VKAAPLTPALSPHPMKGDGEDAVVEVEAHAAAVFARIREARVGMRPWRRAERREDRGEKIENRENHMRGCPPEKD